jgi:hypothetical protein
MLRRLVILGLLAAAGLALYSNRHRISELAGVQSNKVRIQGNWHEVRSGFKEDDIYTFNDDTVSRNGDPVGVYKFNSYRELEVSIEDHTGLYLVEFPDHENMTWFQEVKGEEKVRRRWRR